VNLVGFALQAVVVSRAIAKLGVRRTLFVMPIVALGAYGAIAAIGGFALVRAAKVAENGTEYSLDNTVRQTLFLPTARAAKYKAKAAIDTLAVRAGDTASALVIWLAIHQLGLRGRGLAFVNVGLVLAWLAIAMGLASTRALAKPPPPAQRGSAGSGAGREISRAILACRPSTRLLRCGGCAETMVRARSPLRVVARAGGSRSARRCPRSRSAARSRRSATSSRA